MLISTYFPRFWGVSTALPLAASRRHSSRSCERAFTTDPAATLPRCLIILNSAPTSPTAIAGCDLFLDNSHEMAMPSDVGRVPPPKRSSNVFGPPSSPTRPFGQDISNTLMSSSPSLGSKDSARPRSKTMLQRPVFATQKSSGQNSNTRSRPLPSPWLQVPSESLRAKRSGAVSVSQCNAHMCHR